MGDVILPRTGDPQTRRGGAHAPPLRFTGLLAIYFLGLGAGGAPPCGILVGSNGLPSIRSLLEMVSAYLNFQPCGVFTRMPFDLPSLCIRCIFPSGIFIMLSMMSLEYAVAVSPFTETLCTFITTF